MSVITPFLYTNAWVVPALVSDHQTMIPSRLTPVAALFCPPRVPRF